MLFRYSAIGLHVLLFAIILGIIGFYIYNKKETRLHNYLLYDAIFATVYLLAYALYCFIIPIDIKLITLSIQYIAASFCVLYLFLFICDYFKNERVFNKKYLFLLYLLPLITLIGAIINPWTGLIASPIYDPTIIGGIAFKRGILAIFIFVFVYLLFLITMINCIIDMIKNKIRLSVLLIFLAPVLSFISGALVFLGITNTINLNPIASGLSILLIFYAVFFTSAFDKIPTGWKTFVMNADVGMVFLDLDYNVIDCNPKFLELGGITEDITGKNIDDFLTTEEKENILLSNQQELELNTGKWVQVTIEEVFEDKELIGYVHVLNDITYIKETELKTQYNIDKANMAATDALKARDRARENERLANAKTEELDKANQEIIILLKEVHHRVKNNLQLILSLLNLDRRFNDDAEEILGSTEARISSMALIHEKTYNADDLTSLNMAEFLKSSTESMLYLFPDNDVELKFELDDSIEIEMSTMTSLSLIVNELMTNSFKYAFKEDMDEQYIYIRNGKMENDWLYLEIEDTGIGLPDDFDIERSSNLGLTIINTLTNQIEGNFMALDTKGAGFRIEFPREQNNE